MRDLLYKEYKHVVGVGCSYTYGSHERENDTRANKIPVSEYKNGKPPLTSYIVEFARLINAESYNLAKNGLSFKFLLFYAFLWIRDNLDKIDDTLLVVGLTHRRRETFFNIERIGVTNLKGVDKEYRLPYVVPSKHVPLGKFKNTKWLLQEAEILGVKPESYCDFTDILWNKLNDPIQRDIIDEMYMVMLQNYCNTIGLDILFIDIPNEAVKPGRNINFKDWRDIVEPVFKWPDDSESWKHYILKKDSTYYWGHPNYEDHVELGKLLHQYIHI